MLRGCDTGYNKVTEKNKLEIRYLKAIFLSKSTLNISSFSYSYLVMNVAFKIL